MLNDKDRLFNSNNHSFIITHNLKSDNIPDWDKQFKTNEQFRLRKRVDSVYLTHEIISFHKDDAKNITLDILEDIARQYINLRGANGVFLCTPHFDRSNYHLHFAVSALEFKTGKGMRLSKTDLSSLKQRMQQYQIEKYPELNNSIVNHGNPEKKTLAISDKEFQLKRRTGLNTNKESLIGLLKTSYKQAHSQEDFLCRIKESGVSTYFRNGKLTGVIHNNQKHRLGRLGFTAERLEELNISVKRGKDLNELRKKSRGKNIDRNI